MFPSANTLKFLYNWEIIIGNNNKKKNQTGMAVT